MQELRYLAEHALQGIAAASAGACLREGGLQTVPQQSFAAKSRRWWVAQGRQGALLSPLGHEVWVPAATSAPYFCRASSDANLEALSMGRRPQRLEVKVLSASAHPPNAMNAGIRKKSE